MRQQSRAEIYIKAQATDDEAILAALLDGKATFVKGPAHLFFVELFVERMRFELLLNDARVPVTDNDQYKAAAAACRKALLK